MEIKTVMYTARSAVIEIRDGGRHFTRRPYRVVVNGQEVMKTEKTVSSLFGLKPQTLYRVEIYDGERQLGSTEFTTAYEFVTLDVTRFGAKGDGVSDDTHFIQAAVMACPEHGRIYIPAGTYRITSLFLKSHIRLELAAGAELRAFTEREKFPVFPAMLESYDEQDEYNLGTWEGNPLPMFTGIICGVGVEDVGFLRDLNTGVEELQLLQAYHQSGVKDRQKLLAWQIERKIDMDLSPILAHTTPHKLMRYVDGQYNLLQGREGKYGGLRYDSIKAVVREYADYLDMCEKQHYDLKNSFVLFPKDLQKSHDRVAERIKIKADMKMREDFQAAYKRVKGQLDFEWDGMKIVYPASLDEIITEGHALHHCVGGYVSKVAARKTMILFLRRCEAADKPFYTVEVLNGEVAQVRGIGNCDATPEVNAFMSRWKRQVLHAAPAA